MKYLGKVKDANKLMFECKGGVEKSFACSEAVIEYARSNLKKGDSIATGEGNTTFTNGVITRLVKYEPRQKSESSSGAPNKSNYQKGNYQKKNYTNYNNSDRQGSIIRQTIFKAAVDLVVASETTSCSVASVVNFYEELKAAMFPELNCSGAVVRPADKAAPPASTPVSKPPVKSAAVVEELESDEPEFELIDEPLEEEVYN